MGLLIYSVVVSVGLLLALGHIVFLHHKVKDYEALMKVLKLFS